MTRFEEAEIIRGKTVYLAKHIEEVKREIAQWRDTYHSAIDILKEWERAEERNNELHRHRAP